MDCCYEKNLLNFGDDHRGGGSPRRLGIRMRNGRHLGRWPFCPQSNFVPLYKMGDSTVT